MGNHVSFPRKHHRLTQFTHLTNDYTLLQYLINNKIDVTKNYPSGKHNITFCAVDDKDTQRSVSVVSSKWKTEHYVDLIGYYRKGIISRNVNNKYRGSLLNNNKNEGHSCNILIIPCNYEALYTSVEQGKSPLPYLFDTIIIAPVDHLIVSFDYLL